MKVFLPTLVLTVLFLVNLASVGADGSKTFLRANKEGGLVLEVEKPEQEATDGIKLDRQLSVERGDTTTSSSVHHRPTNSDAKDHVPQAAAHSSFVDPGKAGQRGEHRPVASASTYGTAGTRYAPNQTKEDQKDARYHTSTGTAGGDHHSTASIHSPRPTENNVKTAKKSSKKPKEDKEGKTDKEDGGGGGDGVTDGSGGEETGDGGADSTGGEQTGDGGADSTGGEQTGGTSTPPSTPGFSCKTGERRCIEPIIEQSGVCNGENNHLVEMFFMASQNSVWEDAVSFIKNPCRPPLIAETMWDYPKQSFDKFHVSDNLNPMNADYYLAKCVSAVDCNQFTFSSDFGSMDKESFLILKVDGKVAMHLTRVADDQFSYIVGYESHTFLPDKYVFFVGDCDY